MGDILQISVPHNDEKHDESPLTRFLQVFRTLSHVD